MLLFAWLCCFFQLGSMLEIGRCCFCSKDAAFYMVMVKESHGHSGANIRRLSDLTYPQQSLPRRTEVCPNPSARASDDIRNHQSKNQKFVSLDVPELSKTRTAY